MTDQPNVDPAALQVPASEWTRDPTGRSNNSDAFNRMVEAVARLLASHRLGDSPKQTARLIVAHLAHVYGLRPRGKGRLG